MAKTPPPRRPGPKGGGGANLMQQVQQMQADMAAAQNALADETVEASVGGGMVKVVVTGSGDVKSVSISPEVVDPDDVEMLEDLVLAAVNEGIKKAKKLREAELAKITGMVMPGLM